MRAAHLFGTCTLMALFSGTASSAIAQTIEQDSRQVVIEELKKSGHTRENDPEFLRAPMARVVRCRHNDVERYEDSRSGLTSC